MTDEHAALQREHRDAQTRQAVASVAAGRFIEAEAVFAWLDSWGSGREVLPPVCNPQGSGEAR